MWSRLIRSHLTCRLVNQHREYHNVITNNKIYELRTYSILPKHLKEFLNLTSEEFHLRTSQSKLTGYWTSELGGLNEVVHIWEYDSLEHRAQVRASLAVNSEWIQRYFAKILPWMSEQQNSVIIPLSGIQTDISIEKGVYQLQSLQLNASLHSDGFVKNSSLANCGPEDNLVGAFRTLHGNLNTVVLLWKHSTLTAATNFVAKQTNSKEWQQVSGGYSKVMIPHKVSPLQ